MILGTATSRVKMQSLGWFCCSFKICCLLSAWYSFCRWSPDLAAAGCCWEVEQMREEVAERAEEVQEMAERQIRRSPVAVWRFGWRAREFLV